MNLIHVLVHHLKGEVLLIHKVMVEGALRSMGSLEEGLDPQTVVAMFQQHGQTHVQEALFGCVGFQAFTFSIMWSMTSLCSC